MCLETVLVYYAPDGEKESETWDTELAHARSCEHVPGRNADEDAGGAGL
jgi:hypothetical protein